MAAHVRSQAVGPLSIVAALLLAVGAAPAEGQRLRAAGAPFVVTDAGGTPLHDVQVRFDQGGNPYDTQVMWTDEDGEFLLHGEGAFYIRLEPPGDSPAIQWRGGSAGRTGAEPVVLADTWLPPETIVLPPGGAIAGTVRLDDGTPVPWGCALVRTPAGDLVTRGWGDGSGSYATRHVLPEGEYVVEFRHCGSMQTWGWYGGRSVGDAARVAVHAQETTTGVDAALDPAGRPQDAVGHPSTDAHALADIELLNSWRTALGLQPVEIDWTMVEGNRLHALYAVHNIGAGHDQDPDNPWFTIEGMIAARASGLSGGPDSLLGLSGAPFHWFHSISPWTTRGATGEWFAPEIGVAGRGGLHLRPWPPPERPESVGPVDWPVRWPVPDSLATSRFHCCENTDLEPVCPGYIQPDGSFGSLGTAIMAQYDYYAAPVQLHDHHVLVDGIPVATCAVGPGTIDNDGALPTFNALVVMPLEILPEHALVDVTLDTNHGTSSWRFETPVDARDVGLLQVHAAAVTRLAQEVDARANAIALSQQLFGTHRDDYTVAPGTIVLCREDTFADCLAVSAHLGPWHALLFTAGGAGGALPPEVRAEMQRLRDLDPDDDPNVVIAGGTNAVSAAQADELVAMGFDVRRFAGADRIETAARLADAVAWQAPPDTVLVARADDWADAITAGAYAAANSVPVLLTPTEALHPVAAGWLAQYPDAEVVLLGGHAAIGPAVEDDVRARGHRVRRVHGATRVETSVAIADQLWGRTTTVPGDAFSFVDTYAADGWPNALLGALVASRAPSPVLSSGATVHPAVETYLRTVVRAPAIGVVVGDTGPSDAALASLLEGCAAAPDRPRCRVE